MADREKEPSWINKLLTSIPDGLAGRAAKKQRDYNARQKAAIDEAMGETDSGKNGVDAGEMGKKWDDHFPKND